MKPENNRHSWASIQQEGENRFGIPGHWSDETDDMSQKSNADHRQENAHYSQQTSHE